MSVTQNYTIDTSSAAWQYIAIAVLTQLRADRKQIERLPAVGHDDFLLGEIALGTEALAALNNGQTLTREDTHGGLDGALLATVLRELHAMRDLVVGDYEMPGQSLNQSERRARIVSLDNALLFLENPK